MLRLLAALAVLVLVESASAGPMTRWTNPPFEGSGQALVAGGPGNSTLVVFRDNQDPVRSFDGGKTWSPFTVQGNRPLSVSISPVDGRTWYAVIVGEGAPDSFARVILRTRDGGNTWEERSRMTGYQPEAPRQGADPDHLYMLRFDLPQCGFLCTGSTASILMSRDGGRTWSEPAPVVRALRLHVSPVDSRVAFATAVDGQSGSVWLTRDGGSTWVRAELPHVDPHGWGKPYLYYGEIALDRLDADIAYVRPEQKRSAYANDLYVTRDRGLTWTRHEAPQGWLAADSATAGRVYIRAVSYSELVSGSVRQVVDNRVLESRDAGRTWVAVESGEPSLAQSGTGTPEFIHVVAEGRTRTAVGVLGSSHPNKVARLDLTDGALNLSADLWWNPAAPGTGLTIAQHASNQVFMVWYAYDAAGKQVWRVMPGGSWSDRTLSGTLYETDGPPYFQGTFDPARVKLTPVGIATLEFQDQDTATVVHRDGSGVERSRTSISRMQFGERSAPLSENFSDIWYNAAESGWGVGISHQGSRIFATWYVYGDDGEPMWIIMPDSVIEYSYAGVVARPLARGDIYTTRGNPDGSYTSTKVGTASIFFRDLNRAEIAYSAFGKSQTTEITRIPF
jgi:photosystem II stability/assembly factor-like uncharacterized protein